MYNLKEVINKHRGVISHNLDIDMQSVYDTMKLLKSCLKKRYANNFYFYRDNIHTFIELDSNYTIKRLRADYSHFFSNEYVTIYGICVEVTDKGLEWKMYNMVKNIPNLMETSKDRDLFKLSQEIDNINETIQVELNKILNKEDKYINYLIKQEEALRTVHNFEKSFKEKLETGNIVKKSFKKLKELYHTEPLQVETGGIKVSFHHIDIPIYMKVEPYVYDRCLTLEFTRNTVYLGNLEIGYEGKIKFEPYFKNQKYFTKEISSLKYMRNTFKKYLIESLNEVI